ncbi:MAG: ASCH domain-containing protein [Ottowia sp.]|uniref:ASCH domain-containing protein n=1 Tax=Ottowia sp. TaxID=1898956 RepID=UPI003C70C1B6
MADLVLPLKREYFEQIRDGEKWFEYRLRNEYWRQRLEGHRPYDRVILTLGYPKADNESRRIVRPWRGFTNKTITHPHFGPDPVQVYAIDVRPS